VALGEGELVVNSSRGGGSKDTWVLTDERVAPREASGGVARGARGPMASPRENDEYPSQDGEQ
jgi:hypothetical protein